MRLTPDEVSAIKDCARAHFGEGAVVRLFGSRVRDDLRGGDIDLHVVADSDERASGEGSFKEALQERIGEQRIDVLLRRPHEPSAPIDRIAIETGVVLAPADDAALPFCDLTKRRYPGVAEMVARRGSVTVHDEYLQAVRDALSSGHDAAASLRESLDMIDARLPLAAEDLPRLDSTARMQIDAFLHRFTNMVAVLQDQLLRAILIAEEERVAGSSKLDQRNMAERMGALPPGLDYKAMVDARNALAHLYPNRPDLRADAVNNAAAAARTALSAFEGLAEYVRLRYVAPS